MHRTTYVVALANPRYALFLFPLFNYIYQRYGQRENKKAVDMRGRRTHRGWKRAPIRGHHCRVKDESRKKGRQKFLLFRTVYTPVYAYGKALFRFFRFPFHSRLRRLSVYSARKREAPRIMPLLAKGKNILPVNPFPAIANTKSSETPLTPDVYSRPETQEQTIHRAFTASYREKRFCFSRTNNR